ncbi:MAG: tRNA (N(6)-L-threonylcarbamoyladenosine(37)-C(2))-methylthiotransferase MtaB [Bacteroidales bacterium]
MQSVKKRIAFHTLGCKLNFSETSYMSNQEEALVFEHVDFDQTADIYVINSCSVTHKAEKKCKTLIKQALKRNPEAHIAITGCYSQINPDELRKTEGVRIVLGNADKFNLFEHIRKLENNPGQDFDDGASEIAVHKPEKFVPVYSSDDRTRTFFKIQDGCDYFCTYCTVPLARGRSRSNTIEETLKTAARIAKTNSKEVVLTGVNIGDFGKRHDESFFQLLKELSDISDLERIRISSIEPNLLTDEIIELVAERKNLMPHFHIPLQSGSDVILNNMGRRYDTAVFASRVNKIHQILPNACIAVDLIVGFPGETDAVFEESARFLRSLPVSYLHVFTYSERDNTRAIGMGAAVPGKVRSQRSKTMQKVSAEMKRSFYERCKGMKTKVLWEKEEIEGYMFGFTENYIKVKTQFDENRKNLVEQVELNHLTNEGVYWV